MIGVSFGVLVLIVLALLVDRFVSEAAHRAERERLTRAVMARHMPEFAALEKIIEPTMRRNPRRLNGDRDPEVPLVPEGL